MGFFIDIYVEFLISVMVSFFRSRRAKSWPIVNAEITRTQFRSGGFGCAVAEISYKYSVDGHPHTGTSTKPFLWDSSAKSYLESYAEGNALRVRVKPGAAGQSVLRDGDLYCLAQGLRLQN